MRLLSVSVFAVFNGANLKRSGGFFEEENAVIADAQAELRRVDSLQLFEVTSACFGEPVNGKEDVHGNGLRDGADIGFGFVREANPLQAGSL